MLVLNSLYVSYRAPKVFLYMVLAYSIIFMSYLFSYPNILYSVAIFLLVVQKVLELNVDID